MSEVRVELFTPKQPTDPADGRALLAALERHVPSWLPHRYGWTEPLRHVYDPGRIEHFWGQDDGLMFRNALRNANGRVRGRIGPWDLLTKIEIAGLVARKDADGIGPLLADAARSLDLAYAMAHVFSDREADQYYRDWFELPPRHEGTRTARQGPFPYFLRDLYWANVFGPPYVELFGADRLRTAPAAVVIELHPGCFYLQVTDTIADLYTPDAIPRYRQARDAVKEHLGADCFYEAGATAPRRAPVWRTAAEDGLWEPVEGTNMTDDLRALLAKASER